MELNYLPGEWYLLICCLNCKEKFPLFHDLTRGEAQVRAIYRWSCPACGHKGDYEPENLERYQHPFGQ